MALNAQVVLLWVKNKKPFVGVQGTLMRSLSMCQYCTLMWRPERSQIRDTNLGSALCRWNLGVYCPVITVFVMICIYLGSE